MSNYDFDTADIAILGTGREGRAAWGFLRERFPEKPLTFYTEGKAGPGLGAELDPTLDRVMKGPLQEFELKRHDVLVRSPGISPYRPELAAALAAGRHITTASNLWFDANPNAKTLCITGTKGKSTTSALTACLLEAAGLRAVTAGNIGLPMLEFAGAEPDWWVIELSSYQLCDLQARPTAGLILNLSDEHLDWHGGADTYRADKMRLATLVKEGPVITNFRDRALREALGEHAGVRWFNHSLGWHEQEGRLMAGQQVVLGSPPERLPGRHNLENLAAALTLLEAVGVTLTQSDLEQALASFGGLPHRLADIGQRHGLRFVDDSLSTTPVATLAALEAMAGQAVTLLVGGLDRGLDWRGHAQAFRQYAPHAVIGIPDSGPHILSMLEAGGLDAEAGLHVADDLDQAVKMAVDITPEGGVILLSPGAPSFPVFRDFAERAEAFARAAGLK